MTLTMPPETRTSIEHTLSLYGAPEARHALAMLEAGRVDGRLFVVRDCGCLIGSLHAGRLIERGEIVDLSELGADGKVYSDLILTQPNESYEGTFAAQSWFRNILPGDTPANNSYAKLAAEAIRSWIARQTVDVAKWNPLLTPESSAQAIQRVLKEA